MGVNSKKWLYLIVLSLIWGSSFILIKKSLVGLSPIQLGALRIVFTAVFLFIVGFKSLQEIKRKDWKWIAISGYLGSFFPPFFFAFAQTEIDSAVAAILNSLTPLYTAISGIIFFGVLLLKRQIIGVVLGLLGTVVLIIASSHFSINQNYWYAVPILVSSLGYAININIIKKHLQHMSAVSISTGNFLLIVFPALVMLYFSGFFSAVFYSESIQAALLYVVILSLFGTALAKILFNRLVQISSPVFSASVTYTMPMVAVFWGVFDGERLHMYQLFGGLVILIGVYLANKNSGKKKQG